MVGEVGGFGRVMVSGDVTMECVGVRQPAGNQRARRSINH